MARKFCVMTVGRSGSTSLMEVIEPLEDVAVPNKNIPCEDDELLHPRRVKEYMREYARLSGRAVATPAELIEAFFALNDDQPYAGFKSMPNRHPDYEAFTSRPDIQFITLQRRDYASTSASFLRAEATGTWRRHGEPRSDRWRFDPKRDGARLAANLAYIHASRAQLDGIADAIHLWYEDLCDPAYASAELDAFFGRPVRIKDPKPPTTGASYVENWEQFKAFADDAWARLEGPSGKDKGRAGGAKSFCLVLGGARSGGALLGRLLAAHPEMTIDGSADALVREPEELGRLAREAGTAVAGGIAGDAGAAAGPEALRRLAKAAGVEVKLVHVVRNPTDVVSILAARLRKPVAQVLKVYLESAERARALLGSTERALEVNYEELVAAPGKELREVCEYLGLTAPKDWLATSAKAVAAAPREPRPPVPWTHAEAEALRRATQQLPFLSPYGKPRKPARPARPGSRHAFYAWELGMDLGHLLRFLRPALKLRERGHEVLFAVRDLSNAEATLGRHGFPLMQAPIWIANTPMPPIPFTYSEIILRYGFMQYEGLKALVKAWRELFRHADAGIVLADHSPTALLAAHTLGLPRAPIGSGFFCPPTVKPLPVMRYWTKNTSPRVAQSDAIATRNANRVIADLGGTRLESLCDLFAGEENFLCTFEELDHYPNRGPARYWGPTFEVDQGVELPWPKGDGPRVFAYVKSRYRDFGKVLDALAKSGARVLAYAPGITREQLDRHASARMTISREPLKLKRILKDCDLSVSHGGPGTVTAALLRGIPVLLLPTQLEQFLTSRRVKELGAGMYADLEKKDKEAPDYGALIRQLLDEPGFRAKAREFAHKYRDFNAEDQADRIATRIQQVLRN